MSELTIAQFQDLITMLTNSEPTKIEPKAAKKAARMMSVLLATMKDAPLTPELFTAVDAWATRYAAPAINAFVDICYKHLGFKKQEPLIISAIGPELLRKDMTRIFRQPAKGKSPMPADRVEKAIHPKKR